MTFLRDDLVLEYHRCGTR